MESRLLTVDDVHSVVMAVGLDRMMDELIAGIRDYCARYEELGCSSPARSGFDYREPAIGLLEWMPFMDGAGRVTIKIVGYHPANPVSYGLPTILSTLGSYDTTTGRLIAMADGAFLTAVRTGAASAAASAVLARADSRVLGLIGCGAQAVTQLHALSRVFTFEKLLLVDTNAAVQATYRARIESLGLEGLEIVDSEPAAIRAEADILCTQTSVDVGMGPVVADGETKPWLHVNAVGSDFRGKTELPETLVRRAFIAADFREQCIAEGECQQLGVETIETDLVGLLAAPERFAAQRDALTLFDSTGWALEDHVALGVLAKHAERLGAGSVVEFEAGAEADPWNPYAFVENEHLQGIARRMRGMVHGKIA